MVAVATDYINNYAKDVNIGRDLILTEGAYAMLPIKEPLAVSNIRKARQNHQKIIQDNINKYGKVRSLH